METENPQGGETTPWHTAFFEAIQMELDEYSHDLRFISEHPLNTEPLRIDVVIIKKSRDIPIEKNIASIFRKDNILEYKSPDDYLSVDDFYKVYGYTCLYSALEKTDIKDMTLTFVESRYPMEILAHLQEDRGYAVEEKWPGIYIIRGDIFPIQIIDNRKLSGEENIWLKDLDNRLEPPELRRIMTEIHRRGKAARIKAYLYVIRKANKERLLEAWEMGEWMTPDEIDSAFDELLEEVGLSAIWEARARKEVARNALAQGASLDFVQKITGLDIQTINGLR